MPSIRDIAKRTGLSIATISRYINSSGYVSEQAAAKIEAVIKELGYVPNQHAKAIFSRASETIGLVFPSLVNPFFAQLSTILGNRFQEAGYSSIICFTDDEAEKEREAIDLLMAYRVEGVIICRAVDPEVINRLTMPVVSFENPISSKVLTVSADNYTGGKLAFEHLFAKGYRKLLHIKGPANFLATQERARGFLAAAAKREVSVDIVEAFHDYNLNDDGQNVWSDIKFKDYDGIFVFNDINALSIICELNRRRIRVPEDIGVIGFDNSYLSQLVEPKLSTIEQEVETIAGVCFGSLMELIGGAEFAENEIFIPVRLIERGTT